MPASKGGDHAANPDDPERPRARYPRAFGPRNPHAVPGRPSPPAQIADLAWLAGEWVGTGIAGEAREVYSPPAGGAIAGHFIQTDGKGGTSFYEIMQIALRDGSLVYRLKHFNADLTGWEEKNEVREFRLVAHEGDAWYFDDLTIRRDGDEMVSAVLVRMKDGTTKEYVFRYRRER